MITKGIKFDQKWKMYSAQTNLNEKNLWAMDPLHNPDAQNSDLQNRNPGASTYYRRMLNFTNTHEPTHIPHAYAQLILTLLICNGL